MSGPQVCVGGCLRVVTRGTGIGGRFRGASGTPPPTVCPGMGGDGSLPLIRPCGATFPQGGRQGLLLAAAGGRGGVRAPRPTDGDIETLRGLRGHPFPGRRTVGAGHARPAGLRGRMFAGGCPGDGRWRKVSRGVGDAAPYGLPGEGRQREPAPHPALRGHLPPRGEGKGCSGGIHPSRGVGGRFRGASGTPPPTVCPGMGGSGSLPLIRPCGAAFPPRGKARAVVGGRGRPPTPAVGPRCGVGGSGCSTSGLTKPALYRRNPGRCRGGSRR